MHSAEKVIRKISEKIAIAATVILIVMMMLTVCDVFLRFFFAKTILGTLELTEMMMVCVSFLGLAWCSLQGGHIDVSILVTCFSQKGQSLAEVFNYLLTIALCIIIGWQTFARALFVRSINSLTTTLEIPVYPFMIIAAFGFFMMAAAVIILLVQLIKETAETPLMKEKVEL